MGISESTSAVLLALQNFLKKYKIYVQSSSMSFLVLNYLNQHHVSMITHFYDFQLFKHILQKRRLLVFLRNSRSEQLQKPQSKSSTVEMFLSIPVGLPKSFINSKEKFVAIQLPVYCNWQIGQLKLLKRIFTKDVLLEPFKILQFSNAFKDLFLVNFQLFQNTQSYRLQSYNFIKRETNCIRFSGYFPKLYQWSLMKTSVKEFQILDHNVLYEK